MASGKKGPVKWNIPDLKESRSPRTPRSGRSHGDSMSEKYVYTDTFEGSSQSQLYSDTFTSESYSDTFVTASSEPRNGSTKDTSHTEVPQTLISAIDSSEIMEATNLETVRTATEALETVIEVQSDMSDYGETVIETRISETVKTAIDTEGPENALDTIYDMSDSQPIDSYSYTESFESAVRTKSVQVSDSVLESYTESRPTSSRTASHRSKVTTFDHNLDASVIAPDYDGKSLVDNDDDDDETIGDDYSYTFEATELSSQVHLVDPLEVQREAELDMITEEAERHFVERMKNKLIVEPPTHHHKLEIVLPESDDESEDDYLKHYCKKKIKMLKKKRKDAEPERTEAQAERPHPLVASRTDQTAQCQVPAKLMERAKLNNIMSAMRKAAQEEIHEPRKCPECRELKLRMDTEDAERNFVRLHTQAVKNRMMDIQVEQHLLKMNSISMIAELARQLPRHSERPEKIMDQLLEPLLGKNVMR